MRVGDIITTTLKFYVQSDADEMAEAVWTVFDRMHDSSAILLPAKKSAEKTV